jgi:hypothetical protein
MPHFVSNELNDGATVLNVYQGISPQDLSMAVSQRLGAAGYSIIKGQPGDAEYERGNRVLRLLFGAFYKYFKFGVRVEDGGDGKLKVRVHKLTSGMSGGLIGVGQVKTELKRIQADLATI